MDGARRQVAWQGKKLLRSARTSAKTFAARDGGRGESLEPVASCCVVASARLGSARALPVVADKSIGHTNGRLGVRGGGRNQLRAAAARAGGKKGEREREKGEGRSRIKQARRRELLDRKTMNCRSAGCCSRRPFVRLVARSFELALQPQLQPQLQLQLGLGRLPFGARCALPAGSQSSAA